MASLTARRGSNTSAAATAAASLAAAFPTAGSAPVDGDEITVYFGVGTTTTTKPTYTLTSGWSDISVTAGGIWDVGTSAGFLLVCCRKIYVAGDSPPTISLTNGSNKMSSMSIVHTNVDAATVDNAKNSGIQPGSVATLAAPAVTTTGTLPTVIVGGVGTNNNMTWTQPTGYSLIGAFNASTGTGSSEAAAWDSITGGAGTGDKASPATVSPGTITGSTSSSVMSAHTRAITTGAPSVGYVGKPVRNFRAAVYRSAHY